MRDRPPRAAPRFTSRRGGSTHSRACAIWRRVWASPRTLSTAHRDLPAIGHDAVTWSSSQAPGVERLPSLGATITIVLHIVHVIEYLWRARVRVPRRRDGRRRELGREPAAQTAIRSFERGLCISDSATRNGRAIICTIVLRATCCALYVFSWWSWNAALGGKHCDRRRWSAVESTRGPRLAFCRHRWGLCSSMTRAATMIPRHSPVTRARLPSSAAMTDPRPGNFATAARDQART